MRIFLASLLLLVYSVASFKPHLPLIEYYATHDYIVEVLCQSKDEVQNLCQGHCYLRQKYEQEKQDQGEQILNQFKKTPVHTASPFSWSFFTPHSPYCFLSPIALNVLEGYKKQIFHPPLSI